MNKYEMMFIVKATMEESSVKAAAENVKKLAESLKAKVEIGRASCRERV